MKDWSKVTLVHSLVQTKEWSQHLWQNKEQVSKPAPIPPQTRRALEIAHKCARQLFLMRSPQNSSLCETKE